MDDFDNTVNRIKGYFDDLEEFRGNDLAEKKDFYAASMIVFSIINESITLGEMVMSIGTVKEFISLLAEQH